jgi:hypothetical protein
LRPTALGQGWVAIGLLLRLSDDGKRFVVRADEILTAFLELEAAIRFGLLTEQI